MPLPLPRSSRARQMIYIYRCYMLGWILIAAAEVEVHTPNMDALIDEGILLERLLDYIGARLGAARSSVRSVCLRHYTYKICSPTRSSIQSGRLAAAGPQRTKLERYDHHIRLEQAFALVQVHVNPVNSAVTSRNYNDPVSGYAGIPRNMTGRVPCCRIPLID